MTQQISKYGWQPDLPDQRDFTYATPQLILKALPTKVDMRKNCPPVYNQAELGSCTANAIGAAFQFELLKQDAKNDFIPSRLFIYYNERVIEHSVNSDSGAQIRDGIKTVHHQGVCPETIWSYDINKFTKKPAATCYSIAKNHQVITYQRVPRTLNQFKGCLANGFPFVFGFTVYDSFEGTTIAKTGKVNMPKPTETVVGGHAVMAVGYNDTTKRFIIRNSWGENWGLKGYFTLPYEYLLDANLSDDFWTIHLVEDNPTFKKNK